MEALIPGSFRLVAARPLLPARRPCVPGTLDVIEVRAFEVRLDLGRRAVREIGKPSVVEHRADRVHEDHGVPVAICTEHPIGADHPWHRDVDSILTSGPRTPAATASSMASGITVKNAKPGSPSAHSIHTAAAATTPLNGHRGGPDSKLRAL